MNLRAVFTDASSLPKFSMKFAFIFEMNRRYRCDISLI